MTNGAHPKGEDKKESKPKSSEQEPKKGDKS